MVHFGKHSLASIAYTLKWSDGRTDFEEWYLARRVNAWRDIFPPGLEQKLAGKRQGDSVVCEYDAGEVVPPASDAKILKLPMAEFHTRTVAGRRIRPAAGRFYPQGLLCGLPHVYPCTTAPFRVLEKEEKGLTVDLNHPLARFPLTLEARIVQLQDKCGDTGGRLFHWMEELCDWGPGMQAALPGRKIDFQSNGFFDRADQAPDTEFYAGARLVSHVDAQASSNLRTLYARCLQPGMRVLDLLSGVESHLPAEQSLHVTGVGLNQEELLCNPLLAAHQVRDLNADPVLPFPADTFHAVVCSLSFEYLTDPVSLLKNAYDVLRPGGQILIGVSNRWFPPKAVKGWLDMHEFERIGYILECVRAAGFAARTQACSMRNDWRPPDDPHFRETRGIGDPVYMVRAFKN